MRFVEGGVTSRSASWGILWDILWDQADEKVPAKAYGQIKFKKVLNFKMLTYKK